MWSKMNLVLIDYEFLLLMAKLKVHSFAESPFTNILVALSVLEDYHILAQF